MQPGTKKFCLALATLIGTTVGAGIFALPYVMQKSGLLPGIFYLFLLGLALCFLHLFYGEIVLRTKEKHRLPGYCQKYLGHGSKIVVSVATISGLIGSILVYIILGADFLRIIFSPFLALISFLPLQNFLANTFALGFCFWLLLSYFIFRGIKLIAPTELLINILFFFVVLVIFIFAFPNISWQNFTSVNFSHLFLPYGVVLFAFAAFAAIPEMADILETSQEREKYKRVIVWASLIVFLLYLLFSLVVIAVSGSLTSREALQGLIPFLGKKIIALTAFFGIIAVASSFLILGNYFKNILVYDYKFPAFWAAAIACGLPFGLFLLGFRNFIYAIAFVGSLIGVFEGILIILVYKQAKKLGDREPEYNMRAPSWLLYFLIAIFIVGALVQIGYFLKS